MGKLYRERLKFRRENKHLLVPLVIDDAKIRKVYFKESEKFIRKIDRLEAALEHFRNKEERLFQDWFELTFRGEKGAVEQRRQEYLRLADFHNSMIAASDLYGVPMWLAYQKLIEEEAQFKAGSEELREQILKERERRLKYAEAEMRKEYGYDDEEDEGDFDQDPDEGLGEGKREDPAVNDRRLQESLDDISALSDKELKRLLSSPVTGTDLLSQVIDLACQKDALALLKRVANMLPREIRSSFKAVVFESFGIDVDRMTKPDSQLSDRGDGAHEDWENDESFGFQPTAEKGAKKAGHDLQIKTIYRKLVRKLHPDLRAERDAKVSESWVEKAWHQVQAAYQQNNFEALAHLEKMVSLRSKDLQSLTVAEIKGSQVWLKEELKQLEKAQRQLRKLPSWGFSKLKDFRPLTLKLRKTFTDQIEEFAKKITELRSQHEVLARMAAKTKADTRVRKRRPRRRRSRAPSINEQINEQMTLRI